MSAPQPESGVTVRPATPADLDAILGLRNDQIAHSTALWTDVLQSPADGASWLATHLARGSAIVAEIGGEFAGFASYGPFRAYDGYRFTVENSVYVAPDRQGLGIGFALLSAIIEVARMAGMHVMIAGIESGNAGSIRLHARCGFEDTGTIREVGFKFGRWLDLTFMRLSLS